MANNVTGDFFIGKNRKPVFRCADCNVIVRLHRGQRTTIYIGDSGNVEFAWCVKCAARQSAVAEVFGKRTRRRD